MILAATISALGPGSAWAEQPTVTSQARAANAEFLAFAPPPPEGAGAVCLVDTGVDLNPDTESNVVERLALDGGDPGDVHHTKHGTSMAMVMGGPVNDWGSVGIWPHVRIVSIRAMPPGESSFPFNYYKRAVDLCGNRLGAGLPIKAVNLSLGGASGSAQEVTQLQDYVRDLRRDGVSVVAAAGNDGGAVQYPAAIADAFAVGAVAASGSFCDFSSRGPELDLLAPGCHLDVALAEGEAAYGNGTSDSSALIAAVLTALRSYRPEMTVSEAESILLSTARSTPAGPSVDLEAAFRAAGLTNVIDEGNKAVPADEPAPLEERRRPSVGAGHVLLPRPRLGSVRVTGNRLTVRLTNRQPGVIVRARIVHRSPRGEFRRREAILDRRSSRLQFRLPTTWSRVELKYWTLESEPSSSVVIRRRTLRNYRPVE